MTAAAETGCEMGYMRWERPSAIFQGARSAIRRRGLAVLASLALAIAAAPAKAQDAAAAKEPFTLTATLDGACICHAPLFVGIETGIFAEHGLNIEIRQVAGGLEAMGALATGDVNVAAAIPAIGALAQEKGLEVEPVLVAHGDATGTIDTSKFFAVVARPDSGIRAGELGDLKGKRIGLPTTSAAHQYFYDTWNAAGFELEEVHIQNVAAPDLPSALQSGSVDAIVGWEPLPLRTLSVVEGSYIVQRGGGAMRYVFARWMSSDFIAEHPTEVRAFVAAFMESMAYARLHPSETAEIVAKYSQGLDKEIIAEAVSYLSFDPRISSNTEREVAENLRFARAVGSFEGEYDFLAELNATYVNEALKENPEWVEDLAPIAD
jgi:NitT/TauT family transport system substrate-binding protein